MGYRNRILDTLADIGKYHAEALKAAGIATPARINADADEVTRLLICIAQAATEGLGELYESCGPFIRKPENTLDVCMVLPEGWEYDHEEEICQHVSGAVIAEVLGAWLFWRAGNDDAPDGECSTYEAAMCEALEGQPK